MSDIAEFLAARYSEDEVVARTAGGGRASGCQWTADLPADCRARGTVANGHGDIVIYECYAGEQHANHIARHDPARVLTDVAAKRKLLHWCAKEVLDGVDLTGMEKPGWSVHAAGPGRHVEVFTAAFALRTLAAPYAKHPDFDPEWRI